MTLKEEDSPKPTKKQASLLGMVAVAVGAALLVGTVAVVVFANLAGGSAWPWTSPPAIDSSKWYDVTRSAIAVVGLAGLGGGAIIAYRRQQTTERRQTVEEARQRTEAARQLTEEARSSLERDRHQFEVEKRQDSDIADLRSRYAKASEQLGHPKAAVRLAGVYAMAALADDWLAAGQGPQQRVCVDVLCAYLRMPYDPQEADAGEKEVRMTIFGVIRDKMQDPNSPTSWSGMTMDFTGAVVDGGTLSGAVIQGQVLFDRAAFLGDFIVDDVKLRRGSRMSFQRAQFASGDVSFRRAAIEGGEVSFEFAEFNGGDVSFSRARLAAGIVRFDSARLAAGRIDFDNMVMTGGSISVGWPEFVGSLMTFTHAEFGGGTCRVTGWQFSGGAIRFSQAKFVGTVVQLVGIRVTKGSSFVLDLSAPRLWAVPPGVPGVSGPMDLFGPSADADSTAPAEWVLPQQWPPAEEIAAF